MQNIMQQMQIPGRTVKVLPVSRILYLRARGQKLPENLPLSIVIDESIHKHAGLGTSAHRHIRA